MSNTMKDKRKVVNFREAEFSNYGLFDKPQGGLSWHNISWSVPDSSGFYLMKFEAGSESMPHKHLGIEEFIILEGELTDSDGLIFRQGDCVSLTAGSAHYSCSEGGAILGVFARGIFNEITKEEL